MIADPDAVFTTTVHQANHFPNIAYMRFEGFRFETYNGACMQISGNSHDLLFKNFNITNASGYCFYVYDRSKVFDGTKESTFYNFKWDNVVVDGKTNGAAISNEDYNLSNMTSLALDFEICNCTFKHFDNTELAFPVIGLQKCFNLEVSHCSFSDIGMAESPIGHNVCISVAGYLRVHHNRFTRQWANDVRAWPMKLNALGYNGPDAVNRFYDNISWEKRKYPMYEHNSIQQSDLDKVAEYFSRAPSEIYFNTLYRSRKAANSGDPYRASLVDVYGADVTIKHNLVIEPEADVPFDPAVNNVYHLGAGPQPGLVVQNNLVFQTWAEAGLVDTKTFMPSLTSPVKDAATGRVSYIESDYDDNPRYQAAAADVGAVERQDQP